MNRRTKFFVAGGLGGVGLIVLLVAILGTGGVRGHLQDNYQRVSSNGDSIVYTSSSKPKAVYESIRSAVKPADVQVDPQGYFMRYSSDIVAVTASGTGSRIYIDDERRGYAHWFPFVAGYWGTGGGYGEGIRGGGPGAGK
ncbi:hypothetical protein BLA60_25255 [Actinophytocola xinjiangensis]|uniref:DUF4247 domain-containing protein n=1 Tax=Actinophytocola xinjiangensis TaxID=485602 RepID=A0A7Z0WJK2_9PSEU|nr:DUF4247 domain-containing protein [Actinophytocola xinjiangensis]OLF08166.1 hypothetical protein BLA60_25255 [Actinophytocola xinjiangensis]